MHIIVSTATFTYITNQTHLLPFSINLSFPFVPFPCSVIKKTRDEYIKRLNGIYYNNLQKDKVELITGHAKFTGPNEVTVGDQKITAKHILIATGTKPMIPPNTPGVCVCVCVCVCVRCYESKQLPQYHVCVLLIHCVYIYLFINHNFSLTRFRVWYH